MSDTVFRQKETVRKVLSCGLWTQHGQLEFCFGSLRQGRTQACGSVRKTDRRLKPGVVKHVVRRIVNREVMKENISEYTRCYTF